MRRRRLPATTFALLLLFGVAGSRSSANASELLPVAAYDIAVVDRALQSQAWVVLQAAAAHAEQNHGRYPERVAEFVQRLPRRERMANVWTGEFEVPSDTAETKAGSIAYRAVYWQGHPVGCQVVATGRYGARIVLVSDLSWWRDEHESLQLSANR